MAPKVIDYSKSVIYKIEHVDNPELLYVGSTTDFIRRKSEHKRDCNNENKKKTYNLKLYTMIRSNGGFESFKIMIICEFPCNSKTELLIEEEKYRKELQTNLNSIKAFRSTEEKREYDKNYNKINKEVISKQSKEYREINKEKMKDYQTNYCEENKEIMKAKAKEYYQTVKEKAKEYYQTIKEKEKEYYEANKEQINEKAKEKMTCNCGSIIRKADKSKHYKSKKHINFINN